MLASEYCPHRLYHECVLIANNLPNNIQNVISPASIPPLVGLAGIGIDRKCIGLALLMGLLSRHPARISQSVCILGICRTIWYGRYSTGCQQSQFIGNPRVDVHIYSVARSTIWLHNHPDS